MMSEGTPVEEDRAFRGFQYSAVALKCSWLIDVFSGSIDSLDHCPATPDYQSGDLVNFCMHPMGEFSYSSEILPLGLSYTDHVLRTGDSEWVGKRRATRYPCPVFGYPSRGGYPMGKHGEHKPPRRSGQDGSMFILWIHPPSAAALP